MSDSEDKDVYLHNPSLKELLLESVELCTRLKVPYDSEKIKVSTDYGTKVVIYYDNLNN